MSNCSDVVCLGCGECWCLDGCSFKLRLDEDQLKKARAKQKKNPDFIHGSYCCKGFKIVSDGILHGI